MNFETGACAHHLDILPSLTIEDLSGPAQAIDESFARALISTHHTGIALLATPNIIGTNRQVNPHTIMALLDAATELYDTVILDLPRDIQPWTFPIMEAVDFLGVVCELTIPSLHSARDLLGSISKTSNGNIDPRPIIGKYERRSFKNTLKLSDAEKALGQKSFATICRDPDTVREALNCGEPAGALKADTRFVRDVRYIATKMRQRANNESKNAA